MLEHTSPQKNRHCMSFFRVHHFIKIVNKFVLSQQIGLSTNPLPLVSSLPVFIRNLKTLPTRQAINAALCVISWHRFRLWIAPLECYFKKHYQQCLCYQNCFLWIIIQNCLIEKRTKADLSGTIRNPGNKKVSMGRFKILGKIIVPWYCSLRLSCGVTISAVMMA